MKQAGDKAESRGDMLAGTEHGAVLLKAMDALAILVPRNHHWTGEEREAYESAIEILTGNAISVDCMVTDLVD